jgi:hypothetical protein
MYVHTQKVVYCDYYDSLVGASNFLMACGGALWEHTCVDTLLFSSVGICEHGTGCSSSGVEDRKVHGKNWRGWMSWPERESQGKKPLQKQASI